MVKAITQNIGISVENFFQENLRPVVLNKSFHPVPLQIDAAFAIVSDKIAWSPQCNRVCAFLVLCHEAAQPMFFLHDLYLLKC